jgi:hypothetical protein
MLVFKQLFTFFKGCCSLIEAKLYNPCHGELFLIAFKGGDEEKNWLGWKWLLPGNTKGGSITVPLTSCLTGLD